MTDTTLPALDAATVERAPTELWIAGSWRPASEGATTAVEDPASATRIATVADASERDGSAALDAAHDAAPEWAATPPRARAEILRRAWELITDEADEFARLVSIESGKALADARGEIAYGAEFFRWFSEEAVRVRGTYGVAPEGTNQLVTMQRPVGPCLLITPWNFPLAMGTRKIGPAIAAGCTMVVKPAPTTPLTMLKLASVLAEAGLPDGVLNVIPTSRAEAVVAALMGDDRLRKLSFTGSTATGRHLLERSSTNLLRVSLELGGNAPFVVFDDADLDAALDGAMVAKMRNGGQACTAANRILVHEDLADDFTARLAERMEALRVGRGTDDGVEVGPLIDAANLAKVAGLVEDAVERGAEVVTGGARLEGPGHFYAPTVLRNVAPQARMASEEIFGPVAPIFTFGTEAEAVRAANDTPFGLIAYLYTRDLGRSRRVADALHVGMIGLNTGLVSNAAAPFGGVKHSGLGREGGNVGIDEYLETTYLATPVADHR